MTGLIILLSIQCNSSPFYCHYSDRSLMTFPYTSGFYFAHFAFLECLGYEENNTPCYLIFYTNIIYILVHILTFFTNTLLDATTLVLLLIFWISPIFRILTGTSKICCLLMLLWPLLHLWLQGWCSNIWWIGFKTCISLGSKWFCCFGPCVFPDPHVQGTVKDFPGIIAHASYNSCCI